MSNRILFSLIILFQISDCFAQRKVFLRATKEPYKLSEQWDSSNSEGALFSLNLPKKKEASYLVKAALVYDLKTRSYGEFGYRSTGYYLQWNRNSLIDGEQNNLSLGMQWNFSKVNNKASVSKDSKNLVFKTYIPVSTVLNYYRDFQNSDNDAIQASVSFQILKLQWKKVTSVGKTKYIPQTNNCGLINCEKKSNFFITPSLGIEYDYRANLGENFLRSLFVLSSSIKILNNVSFSWNYQYRHAITSGSDYDDSMHYSQLKLAYKLTLEDQSNSYKYYPEFGVVYISGQNPTEGFLNQDFVAINLSLKVN